MQRARSYFKVGEQLCSHQPGDILCCRAAGEHRSQHRAFLRYNPKYSDYYCFIYSLCPSNLREQLNLLIFVTIRLYSDKSPVLKCVSSQDCRAATAAPVSTTHRHED